MLLVLGLAVGATVIFSLSAVTTTSVSRSSNVTVVTDATAALALVDGHPNGGFVEQRPDGLLEIDFTRGGAGGANEDGVFSLGDAGDPVNDHAFRVVNQGTGPIDVTVSYALESDSGESAGGNSLVFTLHLDANGDGTIDSTATLSENSGENTSTVTGLSVGAPVYVTVTLDTTSLSSTADLSGTLAVDASEV